MFSVAGWPQRPPDREYPARRHRSGRGSTSRPRIPELIRAQASRLGRRRSRSARRAADLGSAGSHI